MEILKTKLDHVLLIKPPTVFEDFRGTYVEIYNREFYQKEGIDIDFIQDDISVSSRHVLRGIHGDGETWISKETTFITRVKYTFNIGFPAEWEHLPGSKGNGIFDIDKIKGLMFVITQDSGNSWDIYIDDIAIQ